MSITSFNSYKYILASKSPRRQLLLKEMGFEFEVIVREVNEIYPTDLQRDSIAKYLCELKANAFSFEELKKNQVLITADTIVWHNNAVLGKPVDADDAFQMLRKLSGSMHEVYSGICLKSAKTQTSFTDKSEVYFKKLTDKQLQHYIEVCKPFDKAGSYGVQEWMGYVGVEKIVGSFYNVMGFPTHRFYEELEVFIQSMQL
jgi:septum formation protein